MPFKASGLVASARDCGPPPPEGQGLEPLLRAPGIRGWSGPYLLPDALTDVWANAIRHGTRDGRLCVWSCGRDGRSGSDDDISIVVQE